MFSAIQEALEGSDHEQLQLLRNKETGLIAVIAIHNTAGGPAFGGVRRYAYRSLTAAVRDVLRLSAAMTSKCTMARVPGGGGKAVMIDHPELDRDEAYRELGRYIENMGGRYYTGPDVGTGPHELASLSETTSYVTLPGPNGPGDLSAATARGVLAGLRAVAAALHTAIGDMTFAVQGLGAVGSRVARGIVEADGRVVASEEDSELLDRVVDELGIEPVAAGNIFDVECDVFVPCALGGILHDLTIERLRCRAIAGSANNILAAPEHAVDLAQRDILVAPDYIVNSGALILGANFHLTGNRDQGAAIDRIEEVLRDLFWRAAAEALTPQALADRIVSERLGAATKRHRWFPSAQDA